MSRSSCAMGRPRQCPRNSRGCCCSSACCPCARPVGRGTRLAGAHTRMTGPVAMRAACPRVSWFRIWFLGRSLPVRIPVLGAGGSPGQVAHSAWAESRRLPAASLLGGRPIVPGFILGACPQRQLLGGRRRWAWCWRSEGGRIRGAHNARRHGGRRCPRPPLPARRRRPQGPAAERVRPRAAPAPLLPAGCCTCRSGRVQDPTPAAPGRVQNPTPVAPGRVQDPGAHTHARERTQAWPPLPRVPPQMPQPYTLWSSACLI